MLVAGLGALCGLGCRPASAGWFDWLGNDTTKLEAANRAVHAAAEVVNESARLQADQNIAITEAITALSSERAQLAGHLQHVGEIAQQDSQWAAALTAFSPVLVAVAVLAVGALALWLAYREHAGDAVLAEVLVESVTSEDSRLALGLLNASDTPRPRVQLPGWNYPVVCETQSGAVKYDNYNGAWGRQEELNKFLQAYAVEKARIEARKKGHRVSEAKLEDGSIKITVHVGGAA